MGKRTKLKNLFVSLTRGVSLLVFVSTLLAGVPAFALSVTQNPNIAVSSAAFIGLQPVTLFDWSKSKTDWKNNDPNTQIGTVTDIATGNTVTEINPFVGAWIEGDGFSQYGVGFNGPNGEMGALAPELAINGTENFTLRFTTPVSELGFAVSTGLGIMQTEINHDGAVFKITTNTGDKGTLTLLDNGKGYSAWVSIASTIPFTSLKFEEQVPAGTGTGVTGAVGTIADNYFGNIYRRGSNECILSDPCKRHAHWWQHFWPWSRK